MEFERPRCRSRNPLAPGLAAPCAFARDLVRPPGLRPLPALEPCVGDPGAQAATVAPPSARALSTPHFLAPGRCRSRTLRDCAGYSLPRGLRPLPALEPCVGRPGQAVAAAPPSARKQSTPHFLAPGRCRSCVLSDCAGYSLPRGLRSLPARCRGRSSSPGTCSLSLPLLHLAWH